MRKSRFGIPLFEHALAAIVFALVVWAVSYYIDGLFEEAEATVVRATIMNIRSGLRNEQALRIVRGQPGPPAGGNPLRCRQVAPAGYLTAPPVPDQPAAPGSWYYREDTQTLYYQPRLRANLRLASRSDTEPLGWRLTELSDTSKEIDLRSVTPYEWF